MNSSRRAPDKRPWEPAAGRWIHRGPPATGHVRPGKARRGAAGDGTRPCRWCCSGHCETNRSDRRRCRLAASGRDDTPRCSAAKGSRGSHRRQPTATRRRTRATGRACSTNRLRLRAMRRLRPAMTGTHQSLLWQQRPKCSLRPLHRAGPEPLRRSRRRVSSGRDAWWHRPTIAAFHGRGSNRDKLRARGAPGVPESSASLHQ